MDKRPKFSDQLLTALLAAIAIPMIAVMVYFLIKHPLPIFGSASPANSMINLATIIWALAALIYWAARASNEQKAIQKNGRKNISPVTLMKRQMPWHLKLRLFAVAVIWIVLLGWVVFYGILPAILAVMNGEV